jgi:hypothetical protein
VLISTPSSAPCRPKTGFSQSSASASEDDLATPYVSVRSLGILAQ